MFQRTKAINKLLALTKRKRVIQGGTWAGKTYGIVPILINKAATLSGKKITVVAESIPALKQGAMGNFKEIMMLTGRWVEERWNATDRRYTYHTGSYIEFHSFDTVGKAQAAGKRTDLFINEGNYIAFDVADALMMRTTELIWVDFNPTTEFWAHAELLGQDDTDFIILNYEDNEALPATILNELQQKINKAYFDPSLPWEGSNIKSKYWHNWCQVYIKGQIGSLQGVCIPSWEQIDNIPEGANLIRHGLDFGWHPDPMACSSVYEWNDAIILHENFYQTQMAMGDVAAALRKIPDGIIMCDSSQQILINDLCRMGFKAKPCVKGNGSVMYGIDQLNQKKIYVTSSSLNFIKELRSYVIDPATGDPIDEYNHLIDSARYAYVLDPKKPVHVRAKVVGRR